MGNICPILKQHQSDSSGPTERSSLVANQHQQATNHQRQAAATAAAATAAGQPHRNPGAPPYTVRSVTSNRARAADTTDLTFDRIGLENLDKRLSDIGTLFNSLLERYSNLKTGLLQLEQIAKEICAKSQPSRQPAGADGLQASRSAEDFVGGAFGCFARQIAQAAETGNPLSMKLKEHAKHWLEVTFDSRSLQYDEISFLNLYNLLGRYAWELRSKTPPLRNTVAMTTQEEETFRRDLLVASLNSESNAFGANFSRLRRVDEQLGVFERLGADAGERLTDAGRKLIAS